jgi:hypothetical protein
LRPPNKFLENFGGDTAFLLGMFLDEIKHSAYLGFGKILAKRCNDMFKRFSPGMFP